MSLNEQSINVITRPLPKDKIKKRPGKAGMSFSYITPDFVIETLNEAFQFNWGTRIVHQAMYDNVAVVGLELSVPAADGSPVTKQQFGSCEVTRGLGTGEAFKGAASDALKKCATLLGLGLELYRDDDTSSGPSKPPSFTPPKTPPARPSTPQRGTAPPAPPRPPADRETTVAPRPATPVAPPAAPRALPAPPNSGSFSGGGGPASVPKPAAPAPPVAPPQAASAARDNPFANKSASRSGPNATQINAMTNLAKRKEITPVDLIANASVVDDLGHAIQSFEELSKDQAVQVIKAAQQ